MGLVVIDTNVLVSAALNPSSVPGRVVRAAFNQQFELVVSPRLLDELSSVLRRPKFNGFLTHSQIEAFVEAVEEVAAVVADSEPSERIRDPDDGYLVALAVASDANTLVLATAICWMPGRCRAEWSRRRRFWMSSTAVRAPGRRFCRTVARRTEDRSGDPAVVKLKSAEEVTAETFSAGSTLARLASRSIPASSL